MELELSCLKTNRPSVPASALCSEAAAVSFLKILLRGSHSFLCVL